MLKRSADAIVLIGEITGRPDSGWLGIIEA
jgi:hypothetical protein